MSELPKVDIAYEGSGYDTLTLRAVATAVVNGRKHVFRGSWVNDGDVKALESLVSKVAEVTLMQIDDDQLRYQVESEIMQRKIGGLQAEIDEMRNDATRSGLSAITARSKDVQHERNLLQTEVVKQRTQLARIRAAADDLIKAIREP